MKSKKFDKKLVLGKKTIVDLNKGEMEGIQGGLDTARACPEPWSEPWHSCCFSVCGGFPC